MKTVRKIIKDMCAKYPNDGELGARVRWYMEWLYQEVREQKHEYKDDKEWKQ